MSDDLDIASEREEIARQCAIRAISGTLPRHTYGECKACGELAPLIRDTCTPCRSVQERRVHRR